LGDGKRRLKWSCIHRGGCGGDGEEREEDGDLRDVGHETEVGRMRDHTKFVIGWDHLISSVFHLSDRSFYNE
jgi:hypothetical protein